MRVGIFGGTFDPVHYGHLIMAEQCREQGRLDQVWFVPAPRPPHKIEQPLTRFDQRVEMLALAIAGNPGFRVDEIEKERAGPSFTVDTMVALEQRHPGNEYFLLVGSDTLQDLPRWHDPVGVLRRAGLMVMLRPNHQLLPADALRESMHLPADVPLRLEIVETPLIDISSRDLRRRVVLGKSLRYFLPRAIEVYIHEKQIYRGMPAPA
jgi:nicotinate-nucleotide adenylyltransferase